MFPARYFFLALIFTVTLLAPAFSGLAAGIGDDSTTLYYLLELKRQYDRQCGGRPLPPVPSLQPSDQLREIARRHGESGEATEALLAEGRVGYASFLLLHTPDASPQAAAEALLRMNCEKVAGGPYSLIGAERAKGEWWVLLVEPAPLAAQTQQPGQGDQNFPVSQGENSPQSAPQPLPSEAPAPGGEMAAASAVAANGNAASPLVKIEDSPAGPKISGSNYGQAQPYDPNAVPLATQDIPVEQPEFTAQPDASAPVGSPAAVQSGPAGQPVPPPVQSSAPKPGQLALEGAGVVAPGSSVRDNPQASSDPLPAQTVKASGAYISQPPASLDLNAENMIDAINRFRQQPRTCGTVSMPAVKPLKADRILCEAAAAHSEDMQARNYLAASTPEGRSIGQRVKDSGYMWEHITAMLGQGSVTYQDALSRWAEEPNNCQSFMNANYEHIGVGYKPEKKVWTVILSRPMPQDADAIYIYQSDPK